MRDTPRVGRFRRRSIRLHEYDYRRDGAYFVTICSVERTPLFGSVFNGHVSLTDAGRVVRRCWSDIPRHFTEVWLDRFVIMPDHLHGILIIDRGALSTTIRTDAAITPREFGRTIPGSLPTIVGAFKSSVTRRLRRQGLADAVWQRNYYEHVIRDDRALDAIRHYILTNPKRWGAGNRNKAGDGWRANM